MSVIEFRRPDGTTFLSNNTRYNIDLLKTDPSSSRTLYLPSPISGRQIMEALQESVDWKKNIFIYVQRPVSDSEFVIGQQSKDPADNFVIAINGERSVAVDPNAQYDRLAVLPADWGDTITHLITRSDDWTQRSITKLYSSLAQTFSLRLGVSVDQLTTPPQS